MKNIIFYFSGTGNSSMAALEISSYLKDCEVFDLARFDIKQKIEADSIGFVYPVYFWGMPLIVERFAKGLNVVNVQYIYAIVTMGSSAGNAISQLNEILLKKDRKVDAGFSVLLPDNYIILHGAPEPKVVDEKISRAKKQIQEMANDIIQYKKNKIKKMNKLIEMINHHYAKKYNTIDKKFNVNANCTGCGLCKNICPAQNIVIKDSKPEWCHKCESCMACIQSCPNKAIDYGKSTIGRKRYLNPYGKKLNS